MKYIILLIMMCFGLNAQENTIDVIPWNYDVLSYKADIDLTQYDKKYIDASATITFNVLDLQETASFQLGLASLNINGLVLNGESVFDKANFLNTTYIISGIEGILKSENNELIVQYDGTMTDEIGSRDWGGVHYKDSILYAMGVGFACSYVSTTRHWLPTFDHPQDKATFDLNFTVEKSNMAVSIGELISSTEEGENKIYNWKTDIPTATYLVTFAVGPLVKTVISEEKVEQSVFHLADEQEEVEKIFFRLPEMVNLYSDVFGDYAFEKVAYIISEKGAMEHQTLINYPRPSLKSNAKNNDTIGSVIAHELAHQWFGDLVTCKSFSDAWLNESFATFCEALWIGEIGGDEAYWKEIRDKSNRYLKTIANSEKVIPLYDFPRTSPSSNYPETIYQKGAVVLSLLRFQIGGDIFFSGLKKYLNKYRFGTATTQDLKAILEAESKQDLDYFFNQWVYGLGWPVVNYNLISEGDELYLEYNQIQDQIWQTFINVPFEVNFKFNDGVDGSNILFMNQKMDKLLLGSNIDLSTVKFNTKNFYSMINFVNITGVKSARENGYVVFPNPATQDFIIDTEHNRQKTKVKIYNTIGALVYDDSMEKGALKLSAGDFTNGLYVVIFETDSSKYIEKLIIKK